MKNEEAWKVLEQLHEWVRFADGKAAALLAVNGILGAALLKVLPQWSDKAADPWGYGFLLSSIVAVAGSVIAALLCSSPIVKHQGEPDSLIFFGHISRKYGENKKGFTKAFKDMIGTPAKVINEITDQIWANSKVASRKYRAVKASTYFFFVALVLAGIAAMVGKF